MHKTGIEHIRRENLVVAAIGEIGERGSLDVTVSQIARRAGVSSALAHHYFGTKDRIFLAVMRHILRLYGIEVRIRLADARDARARLEAIVRASFDDSNFRPEVVSAWLNFYVKARTSPEIGRLLSVYQRRLRSNLLYPLRALGVSDPEAAAEGIGAMIDGIYIRASTGERGAPAPAALVLGYIDLLLEQTE